MFSNNIFYTGNSNSVGPAKLRKVAKVKTLGSQEERMGQIIFDNDRNHRLIQSTKENKANLRNQTKRDSDATQCEIRELKNFHLQKNNLPQYGKENQYKHQYKSVLKVLPDFIGQSSYLRNSMKLEKNMFNNKTSLNMNTSISLKLSKNMQKGSNQYRSDIKNITERRKGQYVNLYSKRKQAVKSYNSASIKTQRQLVCAHRKQLRYETSSIKGTKQYNQDSIKAGDSVWIVCDGHGEHGHDVSWYVANVLFDIYQERKAKQKFSIPFIRDVFGEVESNLEETGIDIYLSGSTCVMVVMENQKLYCACAGDSVAIAVFQDQTYEFISSEHKPCNEEEAKRIQFFGGAIKKTCGKQHIPGSPLRMWGQGIDNWGPGLAVSRSFGDKMAQKYGLIYEPEVKEMEKGRSLKYVVLGSDGLFDQVTPTQICNILNIQGRQERQEGCKMLTQIAQSRWVGYSDDISAIVVYF